MFKGSYNPKAFLMHKKNVSRGLATRTKIVSFLEEDFLTAKMLSEKAGVRYSSVLYHLHLMEDEYIVTRESGRPYLWKLTGVGQKRLIEV
jgi:DNA-binding transcriptional ArsR family regulator